jgi:hypothetical protein
VKGLAGRPLVLALTIMDGHAPYIQVGLVLLQLVAGRLLDAERVSPLAPEEVGGSCDCWFLKGLSRSVSWRGHSVGYALALGAVRVSSPLSRAWVVPGRWS